MRLLRRVGARPTLVPVPTSASARVLPSDAGVVTAPASTMWTESAATSRRPGEPSASAPWPVLRLRRGVSVRAVAGADAHAGRQTAELQADPQSGFDALCSVTSVESLDGQLLISLDHHLYDQMSDTWHRRHSQDQPTVSLLARSVSSDYHALGLPGPRETTPVSVQAVADTGCQSCLAGLQFVRRLGLCHADLTPAKMKCTQPTVRASESWALLSFGCRTSIVMVAPRRHDK